MLVMSLSSSGVVQLSDIIGTKVVQSPAYQEFVRVPALSVGMYRLPAGAADPQKPHSEDEVYYIVSGRARLRIGQTDHEIEAGSVAYVAAGQPHHFHTIEADLTILVFFAPAEGATT